MLQKYITEEGQEIVFEPSPKWVRAVLNGKVIADSKQVYLLHPGGPPYYYFLEEDVRMDFLQPNDHVHHSAVMGDAHYFTVKVGDKTAKNAAWTYPEPVSDTFDLSGYVALAWNKMDVWFEEADPVYVHPHDPHHRIDILLSTRHIAVVIDDETVAESYNPVLLFETGLPTRYYLPRLDVRMDLIIPSDEVTGCAYKGKAQYYSVRVGGHIIPDIAWYYTYPTIEASKVAGMVCFFNEQVDALYVDGIEQPKPRTPWS
ncbi:DUF427 domain-containing protein [Chloroflexota bacterium]